MKNSLSKKPTPFLAGLLLGMSLLPSLLKAQTLPTDLTAVPIYDTTKAGLSFKKDHLSVSGMWEVPGKPQHFVVAGYFGYLWTLYPDTTKADTTMSWGSVHRYTRTQVADFNTSVMKGWEFGVLSGAFDPNFNTNHYFYVVYNKYADPANYHGGTAPGTCPGVKPSGAGSGNNWCEGPGNPQALVVVDRYIMSPSFNTLTRDTEIIRLFHGSGYGSTNMVFGSDGMLYISTDAYGSSSWDSTITARKILRIDVSHQDAARACGASVLPSAATLPCGLYAVPTDNPWYNVSNPAVRKEVYAFGFRNTFSLSYNYLTNVLYGAETGQTRWEEINHILPGHNYGWNAGGDGSGDGDGAEGPCHRGANLDSTSAGGAFSTAAGFITPFTRTITSGTFRGTRTCADFTNAVWFTAHTAASADGLNNLNSAMRSNVQNISPVFRGDPTSPLYGYMIISDIWGNGTTSAGTGHMNFWAAKQERTSPVYVGRFPQNYSASQSTANHNGLHTWSEDSYGNLYPMLIASSGSGAFDWHDIWMLKSATGGVIPLATPRPQVTPSPTAILNGSSHSAAYKATSFMANVMAGSLLKIPAGFSGVELYNLKGRVVWSYRGTESSIKVPANLEMGILQAKFTH